jgi:hypothetical protein
MENSTTLSGAREVASFRNISRNSHTTDIYRIFFFYFEYMVRIKRIFYLSQTRN